MKDIDTYFDHQISNPEMSFRKKYQDLCDWDNDASIGWDVAKTLQFQITDGAITEYISQGTSGMATSCYTLVDRKLNAYRELAEVSGATAVTKNRSDSRREFTQETLGEYEKLLDLMRYYIEEVGAVYQRVKP